VAKASPKTNTPVNPSDDELAQSAGAAGKGHATPTRREREAANRRPLVGSTPADKKAARSRLNDDRERARVGMANGEEKYLAPRDKGEQRRFVRDHIDARWNLGEVMLPIMAIVLLSSFLGTAFQSWSLFIIWGFVALFALDVIVTWFVIRKKLVAKYGTCQRGTFWYIVNRAWQMRFLRLPKPQVKRGQYPS
jgi:hypothetical protein